MRLSGQALPIERLSATSLATFASCPEQWRRKYLLKQPEKSFGARFIGSVDHQANARLMDAKMHGQELDIEAIYRETWNAVLEKDGEPDWKDDDPVTMFERGVRMAKLYQETVDVKPVAIESRFDVTVPGVAVPIVGYIDVCEADKIRERKTTDKMMRKPKAKWRFQGLVYQYAAGLPVQWDIVTRQVTCKIYTADEFPGLYLPFTDVTKTKETIAALWWQMNDLHARYGVTSPWPATGIFGDWSCDYCAAGPKYRGDCIQWASTTANSTSQG